MALVSIDLKSTTGRVLFSYRCENNTYKTTVKHALAFIDDVDLNGLLLVNADLTDVDMSNLSICDAVFINCNLSYTKWEHADILNTVFTNCKFTDTNFLAASIRESSFINCNFLNTEFTKCEFYELVFVGCDNNYSKFRDCQGFDSITFDDMFVDIFGHTVDTDSYYPVRCPSDGAFIGWKRVKYSQGYGKDRKYALIKLEIPEDAKRISASSLFDRRCRCSKAKVLEIHDVDTNESLNAVVNYNNEARKLRYTVGETVYPDSFNDNRWDACSHGIHFFINKQDALEY